MPEARGERGSLISSTLGEYEVLALVGYGAMGTVYLARDIRLDRLVALKALEGELARDPSVVHRFYLEAQTAAPLRHPHIVQVYAAGIHNRIPFIAMEYIDGESLEQFLRRHGRIPWQTAFYIALQVTDALDCAHRNGVIHRDVKPANILLDGHGTVRLTDFGIANVAGSRRASLGDTNEPSTPIRDVLENLGSVIGTPYYMSPEQCLGQEAGPTSDLFSLGVTVYRMIAGHLPFEHESPVVLMNRIVDMEPLRLNRLLPDIPDDVARLVAHLMEKKSTDRPQNSQHVIQTIRRLQREKGGRSAMPEALQAFMREHTRIRYINAMLVPGRVIVQKKAFIDVPALLMRIGAILLVLLVTASFSLVLRNIPRKPSPVFHQVDPIPPGLMFTRMTPRVRVAELDAPGLMVEAAHWIGATHTVLFAVSGVKDDVSAGGWGLAALDLDSERCTSLYTPVSPGDSPYYWQIRVPNAGIPAPVWHVPGQVLHEMVITAEPVWSSRQEDAYVQIVGRKWRYPFEQTVLYVESLSSWGMDQFRSWSRYKTGFALPKPNGHTLAMVLRTSDGAVTIIEQEINIEETTPERRVLVSSGDPVVPSSVRYSPSGKQLAYLRNTPSGSRELWIMSLEKDVQDGRPVAINVQANTIAFSPDERIVAVRVGSTYENAEIQLISAANGQVSGRLGLGELGETPWHPSSTFLVATDNFGLWAIETTAPHRRIRLNPDDRYMAGGASFSQNGYWIAAPLTEHEGAGLVFSRYDVNDFEDLM